MLTGSRPLAEQVSAASLPADHRSLSTVRVVIAVVALALGGFAIGTTEFVTMGVLPDIAADVGVDIPTAGHLISAYALGVVVGAPVIAALGARLPRRTLLVGLMAAFLVGNLLTVVAPGYRTLMVARFLSGSRTGRTSASPPSSPPRWWHRACGGAP